MFASQFAQGNHFLRNKKLEKAIAAYQTAIEWNPNFYLAYHNLGEALEQFGNLEKAAEAYRKAVQVRPEAAWSFLGLSRVLEYMGRIEEARQARIDAMALNPKLGNIMASMKGKGNTKNDKNISIVIITPLHPLNKFNGACQRIYQIAKSLLDRAIPIHIIYTCQDFVPEDRNQVKSDLVQHFGSASVYCSNVKICNKGKLNDIDDFFPKDISQSVLNEIYYLNVSTVLVNYVFLSKFLELLPNKFFKVIDTHDKLSREDIYKQASVPVGFFCTTEEQELKASKRSNLIIAIQHQEAQYFSKSGVKVVTIGHLVERKYLSAPFKVPKKIGFLGSQHVFNSKSIEQMLNCETFKHLKHDFEFVFAGTICQVPFLSNRKDVTLLGKVEHESDFYKAVDVVILPILFGTGLKIKTVEALSYGLPIFGTKIAFDGINSECEHHNYVDLENLLYKLKTHLSEDPGIALKLANFSKALHVEYTRSVKEGISNLENYIKQHKRGNSIFFTETNNTETKKLKFHHVVNFTNSSKYSDLYIAQPITAHSMEKAKEYVESDPSIEVSHLTAIVKGETVNVGIRDANTHIIDKTLPDVVTLNSPKSLPLIRDLFSPLYDLKDDEIVVYSNADIGLTPHFYATIAAWLRKGHDALIINRRTLSKLYADIDDYEVLISDYGTSHPGYDCFVFKVKHLRNFVFGNTAIGIHLIGRVLLWNLFAYSKNPKILKESHLTFHIGDDNSGKDENNNELVIHNYEEGLYVLKNLYNLQFEKSLKKHAPDALKMLYIPNIIRNDLSSKRVPLFIHSMFRTGSTYLWRKLNYSPGTKCYYEPLHEILSRPTSKEDLSKFDKTTRSYHQRLNSSESFWSNYKDVLDANGGVELYQTSFAYHRYSDSFNQTNKDLKQYIDNLIRNCGQAKPILQFNRTALRQKWFKENYSDSINIYLVRNPRHQFASYYESYKKSKGGGFLRTELMIASLSLESESFKGIKHYVPSLREPDRSLNAFQLFSYFDEAIQKFSLEELYLIFLWHWITALLEAFRYSDIIIDCSELSDNLIYQHEVALYFLKNYIYLDLTDCSLPVRNSPLSVSKCNELEKTIFHHFSSLIKKLLSDYSKRYFVSFIWNNY